MVLWSPDTTAKAGGYRYEDNRIQGFSVTHFSGRGISCWQDLPFLPTIQPIINSPGTDWISYSQTFGHGNESARPGYYAVTLDDGTHVDLTVTQRSGLARVVFPAGDFGALLINAGGSANGNTGDTWIGIANSRQLFGWVTSGNCGGYFTYKLHFAIQFDRDITSFGTWNGGTVTPGSSYSAGANSGAYLLFDTSADSVVRMKVGLSFVRDGNAQLNMRTEAPGWHFGEVAHRAGAAWDAYLHKIDGLRGGTADEKVVFYTALSHAFIHPSTFSDVNGEYLGFDNQVHQVGSPGRVHYSDIPAWDFWRTEIIFLAMFAPDVASDLCQSLVEDAGQDAGGGMPSWAPGNSNTQGLPGDHAPLLLATAWAFGARDFDGEGALYFLDRQASTPGVTSAGNWVRPDLAEYLQNGYVSTSFGASGSLTLNYAAADFAIARLAKASGHTDLQSKYMNRSQNWHNLLSNGHLVPRNADGSFFNDLAPYDCTHGWFVEGSPAQYEWQVPFNLRQLFDAFGGNSAVVARLDQHFTQLNDGPYSQFAFMGNEPELKTPWMYASAGAPWKTRALVRRILNELYRNDPGGMPGNDDGGVLSSWLVFSSVGLFPQIPAVGGFVIGSRMFSSLVLHLAAGDVEIHAAIDRPGAPYIRRVQLNGSDYRSPWVSWDAIAAGAHLDFTLAPSPTYWSLPPDPPSFEPGN